MALLTHGKFQIAHLWLCHLWRKISSILLILASIAHFFSRYIELPGCKHAVESGKLNTILNSNIIGIPECPICQTPISYLSRYKEKFKSRKKDVVQVFDHYFILKSNLNKTKQTMPQEFNLDVCEEDFKKHVLSRCEDKSNPMTLSGNFSSKVTKFQNISYSCQIRVKYRLILMASL